VLRTHPVEPTAAPWRVEPLEVVVRRLVVDARGLARGARRTGPTVVAVDGRSAGGKTTFASQVAARVPGCAVVHTDDIAWWESFFGWDHLLAAGVLEPLRRGDDVRYRPPAWDRRGRDGAVTVPANASLVLVEGVGSSRRSLAGLVDAGVWVQSDVAEARRRGLARDAASGETEEFWDEWEREEAPFLAEDRPWERAVLVVCGTPELAGVPHDLTAEVLVGRDLRA
jgi:hypothetical protein